MKETAQYAELLRQKLTQMDEAGLEEADVAEYQKLKRELVGAEQAARDAAKQLLGLQSIRLDNLRQNLTSAAATLGNLGSTLTRGLTVPLAAGGAAAVHYASDTAEAVNKVEVAFSYAAEGVKKWSDTTLTSIGLAKGTALDMAALFGDMATSMGYNSAEAAQMSMSLVELAADLASFKNISIGEADTALKSIFTGETESLKNLGIVMTEVNLKAYALAQGMAKSYESMSQAEKVALRYQYVMEQTKNSQGDFARTFDGTANQLRVCKESLKELAATAGEELLPIITPIIGKVSDLLQGFGDLDEETRGTITQVLLFTATLGPMLKLTGGVAAVAGQATAAYGALRAALAAKQAADVAATATQTGLNVAMAANPAGMLATAIGALVAVVGSFALTAALTAEKTDGLNKKLLESKKAYAETAAAVEESNADTMAQVAALTTLAETENKTAAQKGALLSLVEDLNEAVPDLSLSYDAQTDSLNLTTAAIRDMALAQAEQAERSAAVERLGELYTEEADIVARLETAQEELAAAEAKQEEMVKANTAGAAEYQAETMAVADAIAAARQQIETLNDTLRANRAETGHMEVQYNDLRKATDDGAAAQGKHTRAVELESEALHGASEAAAQLAVETKELATATVEQTTKTQALLTETDLLSDAFAQQSKNGTLSLDTALKLIDAGHAALLVFDKETGAIHLNTEAYRQLTEGKLQEQLTALQSQRDRVNAAIGLREEATAASETATSYLVLGKARLSERGTETKHTAETLDQLRAQQASLDAQIATLTALKNNLGKGTSGSAGSSHKGSSSKSAAKSAAETMVEAYKEAVEELDFLRDMDEINEEEYYKRLEALRNRYLKKDSDAWRDATVKLHDWKKKQADAATVASETAYSESLADLKYFLNMELIDQETYFKKLEALRDQYLEEDSDAWRSANESLHAYQKEQQQKQLDALKEQLEAAQAATEEWYDAEADALEAHYDAQKDTTRDAYDQQKAAAKDAYDAEKQAAKDAHEARKKEIREALALEKERLNEIIAGIDAEIQARRELREDEDQDDAIARAQKRLDAAEEQLAFARTDEDKVRWEQEIVRLKQALKDAEQNKEDTEFYREKELEKDEIKDQITEAEEEADKALATAETAYQAKTAALEADYATKTAQLENAYQAKLQELEADYQQALAALKAESERRNAEAEEQYRRQEQALREKTPSGGGSSGGGKDGFGGNDDPNDFIVGGIGGGGSGSGGKITVDDILNAGSGGYGDAGLSFKPGYNPYAGAAKAAGAAYAAAAKAGAAAGAAVANVVTHNTRSNSANVNIYQAPSLTEGQIANTVQKVLDRMNR